MSISTRLNNKPLPIKLVLRTDSKEKSRWRIIIDIKKLQQNRLILPFYIIFPLRSYVL